MTALLLYAFIYLSFAVGAVLISQKLGLGSVLGYLMAGMLIGPVLHFVGKEAESIQHVAEFGVVMMLFLVGLELAPKMLWQLRHKLLGLGGLQVVLTVAAITGISMALGYKWQIGVAVGCILTLSSTAIVLQTYNEKQLMQTAGGQAGFAVLLFQDVAAIPMLALMPLLATSGIAKKGEGGHTAGNLLAHQPGWIVAIVSVAAILLIVLVVRYLLPYMFRIIIKSRVREMFTVFTLLLVVGIATLMSLAGLAHAKLLIVAIDGKSDTTAIVEYVRRHYPTLPIIARAHDRVHAYDLRHAGASYIIRELSDSSVRAGRIALEKLGMQPEKARELSKFYAARDRYMSDRLAEVYDPSLPLFTNENLMSVVREVDSETQAMMQTILHDGEVDWHEKTEMPETKMKTGIS